MPEHETDVLVTADQDHCLRTHIDDGRGITHHLHQWLRVCRSDGIDVPGHAENVSHGVPQIFVW